ncbi:MAG: NifB/NifX family molybdenum-iron cluster-binding protein [Spirochaetes bacterium]|jgi:predicted Fe-Mo cluster-binding NifX family protein|nr:NifB/NifX family molybdenum-iron cluster-binding protein [Spirochaetota bacterium]
MKIAIPCVQDKLSLHFGHCAYFTFITVDDTTRSIVDETREDAPPHEPGLLPAWVKERDASLVICGGMGQRAQQLFNSQGIEVLVGAPSDVPRVIVQSYLNGKLETGVNGCDH